MSVRYSIQSTLVAAVSEQGFLRKVLAGLLCLGVIFVVSPPVQARSLYWQDMNVTAELRADGSLHVVERQHYVFNGNWNGGERRFKVNWGEHLDFIRLSRVDPQTQTYVDLIEGDLASVDHYQLKDKTLRWRSRLPQDPVFHNQHLIYELEYVYRGILQVKDGNYRLNHNFAFTQRPGAFRHYHLNLKLDPIWQVLTTPFTSTVEEKDLPPGHGVVLQATLHYLGNGTPATVAIAVPMTWRLLCLVALLGFFVVYLLAWLWHENKKGRFADLLPAAAINAEWLATNIFNELPEQIGSLWDLETGAAEVSAMLARLTQEKKLKSRVETKGFWLFKRPVLHLELLVNSDQLTRTERSVINKLFPRGKSTDTDFIREYYRKKGFDPATYLRSHLKGYRLKAKYESSKDRSRKVTMIAYSAALVCAVVGIVNGSLDDMVFIVPATFLAVLGIIFFLFRSYRLQIEVQQPRWYLFKVTFLYLLLATVVSGLIVSGLGKPVLWYVLMYVLILCGLWAYILDSARTNVNEGDVLRRKLLCAARRYFQRELKTSAPRLQDAWYPYLIAFGLDKDIQKWFRAFGNSSSLSSTSVTTFGSTSSAATSTSSSWTGGGGSFGGAGASGAWTAAAAGMAAGFSAPSSSGGGSSGGGSSGGGGGGGW